MATILALVEGLPWQSASAGIGVSQSSDPANADA